MPFVYLYGHTSSAFRTEATREAEALPERLTSHLVAFGVTLHFTRHITLLFPELAADRPPGWPMDATWDWVDALYDPKTRRVVVAEFIRVFGEELPSRRVGGALRHEIGHALDYSQGRVSHSPAFVEAHTAGAMRAERAGISKDLEYYLQDPWHAPGAGREETFAEVVGMVLGGGAAPPLRPALESAFVEVLDFVRNLLRNL